MKKRRPARKADFSQLSEQDLYLFNEGSHHELYHKLGAHPATHDGEAGACFATWAPNAQQVSVIGDFNRWARRRDVLTARGSSGLWEGFVPGAKVGDVYKFHVASRYRDYRVDKSDPFAQWCELPPRTGSRVWESHYVWGDATWLKDRATRNARAEPVAIYEVHLGSWQRVPEEGARNLTYRELAAALPLYVREMGFTHVELLPVMEHPFGGSWGYQVTGYFAPTARYGTPDDFKALVDALHQHGIGVILDWPPAHFATDEHGLGFFDGTHLYEHADPRRGFHPDWKSYIFNYDRNEVRSFLLSSAMSWLDRFHIDGLRIDGVASMLYLDYSRKEGEWLPNPQGGRENLGAITLLRRLNEVVYGRLAGAHTFAEESTAWPMVSRPTYAGGLGFGFKWDMGWMHDTLRYLREDPIHRRYHHHEITFRMVYAFNENFVLPLSHDEVVHGKGALVAKMPGDDWQKFANLRLLYAYLYAQPGKKLLFMGSELAQWAEWNHDQSLDWHLLAYDRHRGVQRLVKDLNRIYRDTPALHRQDCEPEGFAWIEGGDAQNSVLIFERIAPPDQHVVVVCNMTPVPRQDYRVGVPSAGAWRELLNTDASIYGGSGAGNPEAVQSEEVPYHGRAQSLRVSVPPLAVLFLTR